MSPTLPWGLGPSLHSLCAGSPCSHEQWQCSWVSLHRHFNVYQGELQVDTGRADAAPMQEEGTAGSLLLPCPLASQVI